MRPEPALAVLAVLLASAAASGEGDPRVRAGERLYLSGTSLSGEPLEAVVAGDVRVNGRQLSCATCHGQSGLGAVEGNRVVPPIAAPFLSAPRTLRSRPRPPYDAVSLARAIQDGVDSGGNRLNPLMPRYKLRDSDALALVAYLNDLSARPSPGVEDGRIHLATVITPGAQPSARAAMLAILKAYFRLKTANAVDHRGRLISSWPDYYGDWVLHVWELKGPASTWERQLTARYRAQPVFAVVSGIGGDTWLPVHRFCDQERLPCLLPNVDTPPARGAYSLYFSGGTTMEAAAIAARLAREPIPQRVVQVVGHDERAATAARALAEALRPGGRDWSATVTLPVTPGALAARLRQEGATAVVAWLGPHDAAVVGSSIGLPTYASATLLGDHPGAAPAMGSVLVSPFAPLSETAPRYRRVASWLASQGISVAPAEERVADQTFFALTVLSEGLMHVKRNFLRDYLLEGVDHFSGLEHFSSIYPHLSFGPGQRVLSKGCYLVAGDGGPAEWILP